jgi:hypothetical protein
MSRWVNAALAGQYFMGQKNDGQRINEGRRCQINQSLI